MRKPRSYTGEDVVEIHCHGGEFVVREILGLALRQGARQAEPGEFTKRAFLNGRLDLAQAEAVLDLIRARTDKSAGMALDQVSGVLSQWVADCAKGCWTFWFRWKRPSIFRKKKSSSCGAPN